MQDTRKEFKRALFNGSFDSFYNHTLQKLENVELDQFIKDIEEEKLEILLYKELEQKEILVDQLIPVFKNLKESYKIEAAYQGMQLMETRKILEKLPFPVLVLKGMVMRFFLQQGLYKRSGDIDLLVGKKHISDTIEKLTQLGYKKKAFYFAHGEISLFNSVNQMIDLHYDISVSSPYMSLFKINRSAFFDEKMKLEFEDTNLDTFNKEFSLLYLCIHFAINHRCSEFILLFELKEFLNIHLENLDRIKIIALSKKHHLLPILYLVLHMINKIGDFEKIKDFQKLVKVHLPNATQIDAIFDEYQMEQYVLEDVNREKYFPLSEIVLNNKRKKYAYKIAILKQSVLETIYKINGIVYWPVYNLFNQGKRANVS